MAGQLGYPGGMNAAALTAYVKPENPRRKMFSTLVIFAGSFLSIVTIPDNVAELDIYRHCAYTMLATIAIAFTIEGLGGVRALIRVDIVAIATLYFLTFAEFLHPHVRILYDQPTGEAGFACQLVMIGFSGMAAGRHINLFGRPGARVTHERTSLPELSPKALATTFFVFVFLAYFYVLLTTNFNIFAILTELLKPRFARPWQRGQEGNWLSFLTELQLLNYLAAALAGYIFANGRQFSIAVRAWVAAIMVFMLFFDCAEGARNVVLIKAGLFMVTFFVSNRDTQSLRIIMLSVVGMATLWTISGYMLDFRNIGLANYISEGSPTEERSDTFMIDNNMVTIARAVELFPDTYPFPGTEVIAQVFTKWIPRAVWPGKPTFWTVSLEQALNVEGQMTVAATYVGEAYLIAGIPSLIIVSVLLGAFAAAWTRVGLAARTNLDLIYYVSGFFAATLGMRSIQFISVAMLPTVALYFFGRYLASAQRRRRQMA